MEAEKQFGFEVYPKRDLTLVRGQGATLVDDRGRSYIDCMAGIGVANIGHCHPRVAEAVAEQARQLITCPGIFYNDRRGAYMARLAEAAPAGLNRVFLCNSGTEAMEAAIKFARITTGRDGFVSAMRGFHGRTMGALSATFKYRDEFEPLIPGHRFIPFNKLDKLEAAVDDDTAGVVLELVQGEGGVRPADADFVAGAREICDRAGALLIIDEVQTGFGRTGALFACEHFDLSPDIMTVAKAMAGGLPMGGTLCSDRIAPAMGKHGSTFGGNPLACAAALATLEVIESENLAQRAQVAGERFASRLGESTPAVVREIRQLGLMIGIELKVKSRPVLESLVDHGLLAVPAGPTVVRLLPPLVISDQEIDRACGILLDCLRQAG